MNRRFWDSTLNLPKTSLPLRYKATEDSLYRQSVCESLYSELHSRAESRAFQLIDGPPFANGNLHVGIGGYFYYIRTAHRFVGHALNKVLKDVVMRFRALKGERITFRPGWDCHGLPIEMKALSASQMNSDPLAIRKLCRKFALGAVEAQAAVMKQWGLLADYGNPYLTMNPEFEANQLQVLAAMLEKQLIFSARKPVYFSPSSRTALAEAELEYDDEHVSLAAFVKFRALLDQSLLNRHPLGSNPVYLVAWTTTPWTLPSNKVIFRSSFFFKTV
jgi:isoleucyl-tRNA synthetase